MEKKLFRLMVLFGTLLLALSTHNKLLALPAGNSQVEITTPVVADSLTRALTVTQSGVLELSLTEKTVSASAGGFELGIICDTDWNLQSDQDWCMSSSGSGDSTLRVRVANNYTYAERSAVVTITAGTLSATVSVMQLAGTIITAFGMTGSIQGTYTVMWAPTNLEGTDEFATTAGDYGKFFQFNRSRAWSNDPEIPADWLGASYTESSDWEEVNNPCPAGWRLPMSWEHFALKFEGYELSDGIAYTNMTWRVADEVENPVTGSFFGKNAAQATWDDFHDCVFLPAAGYRHDGVKVPFFNPNPPPSGTLSDVGTMGKYWSGKQYTVTSYAYSHTFYQGLAGPNTTEFKQTGASCRCVRDVYIVTASAGAGGTITPEGEVGIGYDYSRTFTFIPEPGFKVLQVLVDGVNNPTAVAAKSYTFTNITENHTIAVSFERSGYTITATAGAGGTIEPAGTEVINHGSDKTYTFTANTGYKIAQVLIDGVNNPDAVSSGTYTFANITANHTIVAEFEQLSYTIMAGVSGVGGMISPEGNVQILHGNEAPFTITAFEGYQISQVLVDGVNDAYAVATGAYIFLDVVANHTITVLFVPSYVGIAENETAQLKVYPNPTTGELCVETHNQASPFEKIKLFDIFGRQVFETTNTVLNISHLANGTYFININGKVVKVIKQ